MTAELIITERHDPHLGCLTLAVGEPPEYAQFSGALLDMIARGELGARHPGLITWDAQLRQITIDGADRIVVYRIGHTRRGFDGKRLAEYLPESEGLFDGHLIVDLVQPTPLADLVGVWQTAWDDLLEHGVVSAAQWRERMGLDTPIAVKIEADTKQFDAAISKIRDWLGRTADPLGRGL